MNDYVPLSRRALSELRNRAAEYRRMAETARTIGTAGQLLRLADRFDALADAREEAATADWRSGLPRSATC
jgi:hypothetical protein